MEMALRKNRHRREREEGENDQNVHAKRDKREASRPGSCLDQPMDSDSVHEVVKFTPSPLPVKHYDPDTTEPVIVGLQTLEELLSWKRSEANPFNVAAVPLAPREPPLVDCKCRTLVSHDMMGGYLDDRFIQGTHAEAPYAFYHWQYIDIFNYFTHNMVTIPPAVWTNAAHKHGVLVLGTFITEWEDGAAVCEAFLKDEESYRAVADKLVQICCCYGFNGWLINVENSLSENAVQNARLFLRYLTEQMHERVPGSLVLWYDSVTEDGELKWQNELNPSNRMFFSACDGFFTNYNWTEQNLESMRDYSEAQGRQADIYVGVDVFARGKVVGGMFETNKALEVIRKYNFSAALFAPGWVYEAHDKAELRANQDRFWALLSDYLHVRQLSSPLPFTSSFCQGFGTSFYSRGQREENRSWFNLAAQEIQPLFYHAQLDSQAWLRSRGCPRDAWNGGCSLLLDGFIPAARTSPVCAKVFSLSVALPSKTLVSLVYKASAGITVSVELRTTRAGDGHDDKCFTIAAHSIAGWFELDFCLIVVSVSPVTLDEGHRLATPFSRLCGRSNPAGWTVRCAQLELQDCTLRELCLSIRRDGEPLDATFVCRIGEITLVDVAGVEAPAEAVGGLCVYDVVWLRGAGTSAESTSLCLHFNATLRWEYPTELTRHFRVYWRRLRGPDPRIPPGPLVLVGRAYSNLYRVTELVVPEPPGLMELVVEPVIRNGLTVPETHWGRRSLSYTEDPTL